MTQLERLSDEVDVLLDHKGDRLDRLVDEYVAASTTMSTVKAYGRDVAHYTAWCRSERRDPQDDENVARYLAAMADAGYKISTIERRLSALCVAFKAAGLPTPRANIRVGKTLRGIAKRHPHRPRQARALTVRELRTLLDALPDTLQGARDRCALLVGFVGALRRSELVGIDVEHLTLTADGIVLWIPRSKTDTDGIGVEVGLPLGNDPATCVVQAIDTWLDAANITSGPVFRGIDRWGHLAPNRLTDRSVGLLLDRAARNAGIPTERLSAHSLRSGLVTAVATKVDERAIAVHGRWRNVSVLRGYIRHASLFDENPASATGL